MLFDVHCISLYVVYDVIEFVIGDHSVMYISTVVPLMFFSPSKVFVLQNNKNLIFALIIGIVTQHYVDEPKLLRAYWTTMVKPWQPIGTKKKLIFCGANHQLCGECCCFCFYC